MGLVKPREGGRKEGGDKGRNILAAREERHHVGKV